MNNPLRRALRSARDSIRTQLWPIPTLGIIAAFVFAIVIPGLDRQIDDSLPQWLDAIVFNGDAEAARTVLDAVASSLITVTSLTFSLTVVTLQLASSQFSPRLLRTFTGDLFVQVTLAIFLATFTFSLTVLRSVRTGEDVGSEFVPRIAVSVSFLLAVASVIALVLFLAHLTRQIRVETVLDRVYREAVATVRANLTPLDDQSTQGEPLDPPETARNLLAWDSGFVHRIDESHLVEVMASIGAFIRIDCIPGSFVVERAPIARVWPGSARYLSDEDLEAIESALRTALYFGQERTAAQDVGYGLRQLVDVANKALSPGINDPTTAVHALGHISAFLGEVSRYRLGPVRLHDSDDVVRVEGARPSFADYLDIAITQTRHYGGADPYVMDALLQMLHNLAWAVTPDNLEPILGQLHRVRDAAKAQDFDSAEKAQQAERISEIESAIAFRPMQPSE